MTPASGLGTTRLLFVTAVVALMAGLVLGLAHFSVTGLDGRVEHCDNGFGVLESGGDEYANGCDAPAERRGRVGEGLILVAVGCGAVGARRAVRSRLRSG